MSLPGRDRVARSPIITIDSPTFVHIVPTDVLVHIWSCQTV